VEEDDLDGLDDLDSLDSFEKLDGLDGFAISLGRINLGIIGKVQWVSF